MYKTILFDLDDTLFDFEACELNALKEAMSFAGTSQDWESILKAYWPIRVKYWDERAETGLGRDITVRETLRETVEALGGQVADADALYNAYWETFSEEPFLMPGAFELLETLYGRLPLGMVSNGDDKAQMRRINAGGIEGFFETIIVSDAVGIRKPDPRIFDIALNNMQAHADSTLFIGDSYAADLQGASNAGIDFCYFRPNKDFKNGELQPAYKISSLLTLLEILDY